MGKIILLLASISLSLAYPDLSSAQGSSSTQQIPLYPNSSSAGRPETLRHMEEIIKPEILDTLDRKNKTGKFYLKEGDAREMIEKAKNSIENEVTPDFHKYDRGTTPGEIEKNNLWDDEVILTDLNNLRQCIDYEIIGFCLKVMPNGTVEFPPYVKYFGPPQKVENVDQPLKTGYVEKELIERFLNQLDDDAYYDFADDLALSEVEFAYYATLFQNWRRGGNTSNTLGSPSETAEIRKRAIDDLKKNFSKKKRFHHSDQSVTSNGFVYNEYHLMPTGHDIRFGDLYSAASAAEPLIPILETLWGDPFVHISKFPQPVFSDIPEHILAGRWWGTSFMLFPGLMFERFFLPEGCQHFNKNSDWMADRDNQSIDNLNAPIGRRLNFDPTTPDEPKPFHGSPGDMLTGFLLPRDAKRTAGDACQGMNQAPWLPVLNTVQTSFHTTAAAVGTVKGIKLGHALYPNTNYDFTYDNPGMFPSLSALPEIEVSRDGDKVQWFRSKLMDGLDENGMQVEEKKKPCRSVERWVLKYGDANQKDIEDDYWNVVGHWRYWRGCLAGGFPIYPPVPQILE